MSKHNYWGSVPKFDSYFGLGSGWADWAPSRNRYAMILTFRTTGASETVTIPCQDVGTFEALIEWGDVAVSAVTAWDDLDLAHEYAVAGDYDVKIFGSFPNIYFNNAGDRLKLIGLKNWGRTGLISLQNAFLGCENMVVSATDGGGNCMSNVTNMSSAFRLCNVPDLDVTGWDTSKVTAMLAMFNTSGFTGTGIEGFSLASCTSIQGMFYYCESFNGDISGWDTSNIVAMNNLFTGCSSFNQDISGWDTSSVTGMVNMFNGATLFDQDLSRWDVRLIASEPTGFAADSALSAGDRPIWGTHPMLLTVRTTGATETFTLPCQDVGTFDAEIHWGDGSTSTITTYDDADLAHEYAVAGDYVIAIGGSFPNTYFNSGGDKDKVLAVSGRAVWSTLNKAFLACNNLELFDTSEMDLSAVTIAYAAFRYAKLTSFDVSGLTSVEDVRYAWGNNLFTSFDASSLTSATNVLYAWISNSLMTSFDASGLTSITYAKGAWSGNALVSFDASGFASMTSVTNGVFNDAWTGGTNALNQASVESILTNIDANGLSAPATGPEIDISSDGSPLTAAAMTAVTSLNAKGWVPTVDGVVLTEPLIITLRTTEDSESVTIPCQDDGAFDATIDWGDGQISKITAYNDADLTHEFAVAGDHDVKIFGSFPNIFYEYGGDKEKVIAVSGKNAWDTLSKAFWGASNLTSFDTSQMDFTAVGSLLWAFRECNLASFDASGLTNAIDLSSTWRDNPNLSSFDASGLASANNAVFTWTNCNLTSFDTSGMTSLVSVRSAWQNNALVSFDASGFASMTSVGNYAFRNAWAGGTNDLNQASVESIFVNIDANGLSAPAESPQIDIVSDGSPLTAAAQTAAISLKAKGWQPVVDGVTVFSPADLFASGEKGFWLDLGDISTLFQDVAGTTPVTAAGQTVKRINDKSGNGVDIFTDTSSQIYRVDGNGVGYVEIDGDCVWNSVTTQLDVSSASPLFASVGGKFINTPSSSGELLGSLIDIGSPRTILATSGQPSSGDYGYYDDGTWKTTTNTWDTNNHVLTFDLSTANGGKVYLDGSEEISDTFADITVGGVARPLMFQNGTSNSANGNFYQYVLRFATPTEQEKTALKAYYDVVLGL